MYLWSMIASLCCLLCTPACSYLFAESEGAGDSIDAGTAPPACERSQITYPRGDLANPAKSSLWFEHIDYRQGTISFWVGATTLPAGEVELLNLGGIRVLTQADGRLWAEFKTGTEQTVTASIQLDPWTVGDSKFIALRWDARNKLSGTQGGGAYLVMLHADGMRSGGQLISFTPTPLPQPALVVGDADGLFTVDELVIYRRPLYVDDAARTGEDPFRELSQRRAGPAQLPKGGLDVMFATSNADCPEPMGWSRAADAEVMSVRYPVATGGFDFIPPAERVFSIGMMVTSREQIKVELLPSRSYTFSVLAHSAASATAVLEIFVNDEGAAGARLAQVTMTGGTQQNPNLMVGSFTMPESFNSVLVSFAPGWADAGSVYFHALDIRKNVFSSASFEVSSDEMPPGEELEGWQTRGEVDVYRSTGSNESDDSHSACFSGTGMAGLSQDSISGALDDKTFYAVGAEFMNFSAGSQDYVGAKIFAGDNSSFLDSDAWQPLRGEARGGEGWFNAGMVSYRLLDEAGGTEANLLSFGNDDETLKVDYCIDNVYLYPLNSVPALAL